MGCARWGPGHLLSRGEEHRCVFVVRVEAQYLSREPGGLTPLLPVGRSLGLIEEVVDAPLANGQPVEFGEVLFRLRPMN